MQEEKRTNVLASVGITGALLGAGITAIAFALKDKGNRKKVVHSIRNFRKQAADMLSKAGEDIRETGKDIKETKDEFVTEMKESKDVDGEKNLKSL